MKKNIIASLFSLMLSTGCQQGCGTQGTQGNNDALMNLERNTRESVINGEYWKFTLPPNYEVTKYNISDKGEELFIRSVYTVGNDSIVATVVSFPIDENDNVDEMIDLINKDQVNVKGFQVQNCPMNVEFANKKGSLCMGTLHDKFVVLQFTSPSKKSLNVLRCGGSLSSQLRVKLICKNLLERLQYSK